MADLSKSERDLQFMGDQIRKVAEVFHRVATEIGGEDA